MGSLVRFAVPVLTALFLQAMYGAVDLLVVEQFANKADTSAVATDVHITMTLTNLVACLAMGATILLGQQIGEGKAKEGRDTIGACIALFGTIGVALTVFVFCAGFGQPPRPRARSSPNHPANTVFILNNRRSHGFSQSQASSISPSAP